MSDYPMLISNKLHSFRNFLSQKYIKSANLLNDVVYYFAARMRYFPDLCVISLFFVSLRLCIKNLFYE